METFYKFKKTGKYKPISWIINNGVTGQLTVNTDKKNKEGKSVFGKYAIRYVHNESSIFVEDQSEFANNKETLRRSSIVFEEGYLSVPESNQPLLLFLRIHPENGKQFVEIDDAKEAKESLQKEDLISEIKYKLLKMAKNSSKSPEDKQALESIAATLLMSLARVEGKSSDELRKIIHPYVEENPYRFFDQENKKIDIINNDIRQRFFALKALKKGILDITRDQKRVVWGKNKEVVLNIPIGRRPVEFLAEYLLSNDGTLILESIQNELQKEVEKK